MQIVWFAEIKWDYLRTRKQQIISRMPAGVRLLYLEPYVKGRRNRFRVRTEGPVFCATIPFIKSAPYFPLRAVLDRRSARQLVDWIARFRIQQVLRQLAIDPRQAGMIVSNIFAADIASQMGGRFLLYDCNDDHSKFPGMRAWTEAYFYRTTRRADAVFASSQALLQKVVEVRGGGNGCEYLGNGVDVAHFDNEVAAAAGRDATRKERPRLGYLGALAPWLDYDAIAGLARAHPEWEIVLVGPILLGVEAQVLQLTELPNVFRLPAVPYDRVPETMAQFDVGLIPFRYNELTRGVNPNKLYEYFAAGLPVVATRFSEEVRRYPDLGRAVDPGPEFIRACEETIAELADPGRAAGIAERARRAARENDWDVIAEQFWQKVEALMQGGNAKESQHG